LSAFTKAKFVVVLLSFNSFYFYAKVRDLIIKIMSKIELALFIFIAPFLFPSWRKFEVGVLLKSTTNIGLNECGTIL